MSRQNDGPVAGPDGGPRCPWALSAPEYLVYHDDEWGRPIHGDDRIYERLTLEAFQSGLSWLTILRKRPGFRAAFDGFAIAEVAAYGVKDVNRLLADPAIIRNRAKIEAAITNARAALDVPSGLDALAWSFAPDPDGRPVPHLLSDLASTTPESKALAKELKQRGFVFVGPITVHALMQATGMVNDHLAGCLARS